MVSLFGKRNTASTSQTTGNTAMYTKALALAASARAKTAAARLAKAPVILKSQVHPTTTRESQQSAGTTAREPNIPLIIKNRFLRSIPETIGTYRHNGKHVQGSLRRKIVWLIFAEKFVAFSETMKLQNVNSILFVAMGSSLNDEEVYYSLHKSELMRYKKSTMQYLKGLRAANVGQDNPSHHDPFSQLQIILREKRMEARENFSRLLTQHSVGSKQHKSMTRGNKFDAVVTVGGTGNSGAKSSTLDFLESQFQNVVLEITALSIEHQLFAYCCAQHQREVQEEVRDAAVATQYSVTLQLVVSFMIDKESAAVLSDLLTGAKHLRDILLARKARKR